MASSLVAEAEISEIFSTCWSMPIFTISSKVKLSDSWLNSLWTSSLTWSQCLQPEDGGSHFKASSRAASKGQGQPLGVSK